MKKRKEIEESVEIEEVKLRPIFGMEPGLYLTILYSILLLIFVGIIGVLPGMIRGGAIVEFRSAPSGAAVYVDETYVGSTPLDKFLEAGGHSLRIEKPNFLYGGADSIIVSRRIFGSLFFPKHKRFTAELTLADPEGFASESFNMISKWALVGSFHRRYRYPASILPATEVFLATRNTGEMKKFLRAASNNLGALEMVEDFDNSIEKGGIQITDLGLDPDLYKLYSLFSELSAETTEEPAEGASARAADNKADAKDVPNSEQLYERLRTRIDKLSFESFYSIVPDRRTERPEILRFNGHSFRLVPGSMEAPIGNQTFLSSPENRSGFDLEGLGTLPHSKNIQSFYVDTSEVSSNLFSRFLEENPDWRLDNLQELEERGLVTSDYLHNFDPESEAPVNFVSWYAAKAYARWLRDKMPRELSEKYRPRLLYEDEWEYAARFNRAENFVDAKTGYSGPRATNFERTGRLDLADMRGNLWEWTEGWYFPSDLLDGTYGLPIDLEDTFGDAGEEKSVRGGSWANDMRDIPVWVRASQPPSWCTPFTGFRIALEVVE